MWFKEWNEDRKKFLLVLKFISFVESETLNFKYFRSVALFSHVNYIENNQSVSLNIKFIRQGLENVN